ncbi:hypothetical protein AC579_8831 [Pseudocercospora musae]|uniref:Stress-response A/B barrel domain-containing protein n=1 Tax=Pseudocercospora musae TaxID=113226 RepID=A0A139HDP0_9PEZI|nr:hypothetical protein AC579_8831 [Pseudocercospora musae]
MIVSKISAPYIHNPGWQLERGCEDGPPHCIADPNGFRDRDTLIFEQLVFFIFPSRWEPPIVHWINRKSWQLIANMVVYHVVLFKLNPGTSDEKIAELKAAGEAMVGKVPGSSSPALVKGLLKFDFGPPLASTAHRAQGFNLGLIAVLEKPEDVRVYAEHPAHLKVHAIRESICGDTLAYDLAV